MAYSWDNRVKFVVRYMYDIDGNGTLDKSDFECLAVRNTVIEVSFFSLFKCDELAIVLLRIKILFLLALSQRILPKKSSRKNPPKYPKNVSQ